ncbi:4-hydroxy-tetrahydrodipicolinate synthase [Succinispira mobilis]|uniref:4-hydroxy-tetrahydrodipicolinate synthase n=1 Tax=Succinispira mobilis TaxID=78120 RepID=UPI00037DB862|nr:4-hydroxy-tetrahydrodipicolinate synthase [Succinispira mobilis]
MFGRLITAMITPMNDDGSINYQLAADFAENLINNGSDALVVAGSTGEAATLSADEKLELFRVVAQRVNGRAKIIGGTGSNDTQSSINLTKQAASTGIDGVMLVGPYYNKPTQQGFYEHFKAVATATELPVVLYNVPGRTSSNIAPATVAKLANELPNVVALKEACGNLEQVIELMSVVPEDFIIYSGDDELTIPMMAIGAHGVISVVGNIAGNEMQEMIQAFLAKDITKAAKLQVHMHRLIKAMFMVTNPIPVKAAACLTTLNNQGGKLRLPLTPMSAAELTTLIDILKTYNKI